MMFGAGISEFIIVFLLGLGVGVPVGVPPLPQDDQLMQIGPEECVYYTYWAGFAKPDADSNNPTEQMLAGEEMQHLFKKLNLLMDTQLTEGMTMMEPNEKALAESAYNLAQQAFRRPMALYLSDFEVDGDDVNFTGGLAINLGDDAQDQLETFIVALKGVGVEPSVSDLNGQAVYEYSIPDSTMMAAVSASGDYFAAATSAKELESLLERMSSEPASWMAQSQSQLEIERISSRSYINMKKILEIASGAIAEPEFDRMMNAIGISGIDSYLGATGLDDDGFTTKINVELAEEQTGLIELLNGPGLDIDDLQVAPADSPLAITLQLSPETLYEVYFNIVSEMEPRAVEEMEAQLGMAGEALGIRIREDIINSFGDRLTIYAAPDDGGLLSGWTASFEVEKPMTFVRAFDKLMGVTEESLNGEFGPQLSKLEFANNTIYSMSFPNELPITPSWCLHGDELLFSLFPQSIKSHLRTNEVQSSSLAKSAAGLASFSGDPNARIIAYSQIDHAEMIRTFFPYVQFAGQFLFGEMQGSGIDFDMGDLPSVAALTKGVKPGYVVVRRTATGVELETHQTIPSGEIGTLGPIATAVLLPAVGTARIAARRTQSTNNMRQILLSFHNYHDVYKGLPSSYSVDADGKPLLSWRVHILPFMEQQALYDQFHLDEPWDSEHNRKLIDKMPMAYATPGGDPTEGKTPYQVPRGKNFMFSDVDMGNIARAREARGLEFRNVTDGLSNTIMLVETNMDNAVTWTKPDDFTAPEMGLLERLKGTWTGVILIGMGDGSTQAIPDTIETEVLMEMFTRDGGEVIEWDRVHGFDDFDAPRAIRDAPAVRATPIEIPADAHDHDHEPERAMALPKKK